MFDISASKTSISEWTVYSLAGVFTTSSATLPTDVCPVTNINLCEDRRCRTIATDAGLRITETDGVFALEVDRAVI